MRANGALSWNFRHSHSISQSHPSSLPPQDGVFPCHLNPNFNISPIQLYLLRGSRICSERNGVNILTLPICRICKKMSVSTHARPAGILHPCSTFWVASAAPRLATLSNNISFSHASQRVLYILTKEHRLNINIAPEAGNGPRLAGFSGVLSPLPECVPNSPVACH